ncbi:MULTISPECIES: hypothetical protein [unclassified Streptomyces]|uniref:hypothetical protein n=1 Tax=unclassified Streptomyces TaxID=2593676 RepID=UPI0004C0F8A1|nr:MULTISPECIES: hypothetical protein [unclassified Streptomyces]
MATHPAPGNPRLSLWRRVREYAVPPSMIETATARRRAGDWAGACAAAGVDVDLDLRAVARAHGRDLAARVRDDLRHLAPDLLRWHLPRIAPDGLLRPGLTLALARYDTPGPAGPAPPHLVVRTPPAWADGGQRIGLALWDGTPAPVDAPHHPHPRPSRRFRLDLHRHLWDARRAGELRERSGAGRPPDEEVPGPPRPVPDGRRCAVGRWAAEAGLLLAAEGRGSGAVLVRLGGRRRLLLDVVTDGPSAPRLAAVTVPADGGGSSVLPVLPDAATWVPPDLELLRAGELTAGRLHPLVAAALAPDRAPDAGHERRAPASAIHIVPCRGARHRIGPVDGVLAPLDHTPEEIRREELLAALTGEPLPCLRVVDAFHRRPDCFPGVLERLNHGDITGALAVVEGLLGPGAVLRDGPLRDALENAARRRIAHGLYRAGLADPGPGRFRAVAGSGRGRRWRPRTDAPVTKTFY